MMDKQTVMLMAPLSLYFGLTLNYFGMTLNSCQLMLDISQEYRDDYVTFIDQPWHRALNTHLVPGMRELTGQGCPFGRCMPLDILPPTSYLCIDYLCTKRK